MKFLKTITLASVFIMMFTGYVAAQVAPQTPDLPTSEDVSDEEIVMLASTIEQLEPIQLEAEGKIEVALEAEGISLERFQQMMMAMQNPQVADQVNITEEEMEKVQQLQPALMEIQGEAEEKITEKIEDNGFTLDRYLSIIMGMQEDAELLERLQTELGVVPQP